MSDPFRADEIRQFGDPVLRTRCPAVSDFGAALAAQAERMIRICERSHGVGLAAPQTGLLSRMFVMIVPDEQPRVLVNPRLITASGEEESFDEGCLSLAHGRVLVPVVRPAVVEVVASDLDGAEAEERLDGFHARIFQHELDHLDGVLTLDRAIPSERRRALGELRVAD